MVSSEKLNAQGREVILAETDQVRQSIVTFAHDMVVLYLGIDKFALDEPSITGEGYDFFVLIEALNLPDQENTLALAVRLEPSVNTDDGVMPTTQKSLTVLHPISRDIDVHSQDFEPTELPHPEVVYFVFENDGIQSHFAVGSDASFFYIPSDTTHPQIEEADAMSEISDGIEGKVVQSGLPFLASLYEDLINMRAVRIHRDVLDPLPSE